VSQVVDTGGGVHTKGSGSFARTRAGRIVEVHVGRLASLADVQQLDAAVLAAVERVGGGALICADYRDATPLTGEVANAWSRGMRRANASIARSALLVDPANTVFNLQVERIVRCATNERRRIFRDARSLCDWLDGALTEAEREAVRRWAAG